LSTETEQRVPGAHARCVDFVEWRLRTLERVLQASGPDGAGNS
jgi:hypothetical protein